MTPDRRPAPAAPPEPTTAATATAATAATPKPPTAPEPAPPPPRTPAPPLRDFYEDPAVPVASGDERSLRQARMLAAALRQPGQSGRPGQSGQPSRPGTGGGAGRGALILDVGCGDGRAAAVAARELAGHRLVGVDWSHDALRRAAARVPAVVRGELDGHGLPFASGSADAVLFSEVVEHLVDPDGALDELRRVLRPGGHLMLSTPNLAAWYNRGLLLAGVQPVFSEVSLRAVHGRPGNQVVGHLRLYTARALRSFLEASGFRVVTVAGAPFHGVPRPLRALDRALCRVPSAASILLAHARRV
ncbi:class I SAM-dependent methyltransferase [Streptomyces sp. URMC 123]|uniref:class I SAM-dependent methyltransferase n=1 Tax=Streptomyces sp. URMC 123 TaxID=3423403 RepID=UPI003F1E246F